MADTGHHDDHGMPAPEPEHIKAAFVFGWGFAVFGAVLVSIALLGAYFWVERSRAFHSAVSERPRFGTALPDLRAKEQDRLTKYESLGQGRYQIPIERAMELVVKDGL